MWGRLRRAVGAIRIRPDYVEGALLLFNLCILLAAVRKQQISNLVNHTVNHNIYQKVTLQIRLSSCVSC